VVGIWAALLLASVVTIGALLGSALTSALELTNDPESQRAEALADEHFGDGSLTSEVVIVRSASSTVDDPSFRRKVEELAATLERTDAVVATRTFVDDETLVSSDRRAALIPLVLRPGAEEESGVLTETLDIVAAAEDARFEIGITGQRAADADLETLAQEDLKTGELFFGAPAALLVLLLVFGTVVAGLIPLLMAIVSIIVTLAIVAIAGQGFAISLFVVNMVTAMGLALGIDYSLFIAARSPRPARPRAARSCSAGSRSCSRSWAWCWCRISSCAASQSAPSPSASCR
jgi:RND superfamily putative drug exporter